MVTGGRTRAGTSSYGGLPAAAPRSDGPRRSGHSLPELIVAVTFLATTLVAVGGTAVLGGRWTGRAVKVQKATRLAAVVLDSLAAVPAAGSGSRDVAGLRVAWRSVGSAGIRVQVSSGSGGPPLVVLEGARTPAVPVLPDVGGDAADASGFQPAEP